MGVTAVLADRHRVGRYPGWQMQPSSPSRPPVSGRPVVCVMKAGPQEARLLTVAGAAQVRPGHDAQTLLLPVELQAVNQPASTNLGHCTDRACTDPTAEASACAYNGSQLQPL